MVPGCFMLIKEKVTSFMRSPPSLYPRSRAGPILFACLSASSGMLEVPRKNPGRVCRARPSGSNFLRHCRGLRPSHHLVTGPVTHGSQFVGGDGMSSPFLRSPKVPLIEFGDSWYTRPAALSALGTPDRFRGGGREKEPASRAGHIGRSFSLQRGGCVHLRRFIVQSLFHKGVLKTLATNSKGTFPGTRSEFGIIHISTRLFLSLLPLEARPIKNRIYSN